jgi:putative oxidoreductase
MATHTVASPHAHHEAHAHDALRGLVPIGRVLFATIFVLSAFGHFSANAVAYAASAGTPFANIVVPAAGVLALVGGLSIMLGLKARWGAALLVLFLVPVTLIMHRFWSETDAMQAMVARAMFLKNVSMLGGALLLMYFGAGPISVDESIESKRIAKREARMAR